MNKKRLIRDQKWFFQYFPYHQIYMDNEWIKGWVAINYLTDGEKIFWEFEKAGSVPVCGKDMIWLTMIPDNASRSISAFFLPDRRVSAWYIDIIEETGVDKDGVVFFVDKYLDVLLTPEGDVRIDDRDELDAAYDSGEISIYQYEAAINEAESIVNELADDIGETEKMCRKILEKAEEMISKDRFTVFLDIDGVLDIYNPNKHIQELMPEAIGNLKSLVTRTKADVVIISDWRYGWALYREKAYACGYDQNIDNWDNLMKVLAKEEIKISGVTVWDENIRNRTGEIKRYLDDHPDIRRYVILDDCFNDHYESDREMQKHLVFVDALKGLREEDLISACKVMNMQRQTSASMNKTLKV